MHHGGTQKFFEKPRRHRASASHSCYGGIRCDKPVWLARKSITNCLQMTCRRSWSLRLRNRVAGGALRTWTRSAARRHEPPHARVPARNRSRSFVEACVVCFFFSLSRDSCLVTQKFLETEEVLQPLPWVLLALRSGGSVARHGEGPA